MWPIASLFYQIRCQHHRSSRSPSQPSRPGNTTRHRGLAPKPPPLSARSAIAREVGGWRHTRQRNFPTTSPSGTVSRPSASILNGMEVSPLQQRTSSHHPTMAAVGRSRTKRCSSVMRTDKEHLCGIRQQKKCPLPIRSERGPEVCLGWGEKETDAPFMACKGIRLILGSPHRRCLRPGALPD